MGGGEENGSRGGATMTRDGEGSALGPLLAHPVCSFLKQTQGGLTLREDEAHRLSNPKPQLSNSPSFLTGRPKASYLNSFSIISKMIQIPLSPRTLRGTGVKRTLFPIRNMH